MPNELSKNLYCVQMRSGVEVWVEGEDTKKLQGLLEKLMGKHIFINFLDQTFNTADVVGIFSAATMEDNTRRKNGQWKCYAGEWHDRQERCECDDVVKSLKEKYAGK